jgi:hypothetical protein
LALRGVGDGGGVGREEIVEQADEVAAAVFGGGFGILGRGELGDGRDRAEVFIEDELFDEVFWRVGVIGGGGVSAGGGAAVVASGVVAGGAAVAAGGGAGFAKEVSAGDEEAVQKAAGALVVELVGGDAGEDLGEGKLDAGAVVDGGQLEDGVGGMDSAVTRGGAAGGVVMIAKGFSAQGG